jgi:transcriptional regulator with GAF, ATPase, and Fis domain
MTCDGDSPIRELQNLIERAVIPSQWVLRNPLQTAGSQGVIIPPTVTTLRDSERTLILATLEAVGWVIGGAKGAAAKLGLKCTTLICKMQKLGIYPVVSPKQPGCDLARTAGAGLATVIIASATFAIV